VKTLFFVFVFIWVRWTVPRFRYDQIMHLGWKVLLPTSLAYVVLMAAAILTLDTIGLPFGFVYGLILTAVNMVALLIFLFIIDRDRVISGSQPVRSGGTLPAGMTTVHGREAVEATLRETQEA
jgi:NADH-quinone oxidoreductase subunit H